MIRATTCECLTRPRPHCHPDLLRHRVSGAQPQGLRNGRRHIIFVPSYTDDRQDFLRVRYCCHARAIENQVYVAVTGTVKGLGLHYGQTAIIIPSDFPFARDGITAEGVPNMEQIVIADVDLGKLLMNRVSGATIPLDDKRVDVYDNDVEIVSTV